MINRNISDLFSVLVDRTSNKVLPVLQAFDSGIQRVSYQHGHPIEIAETLMQLDSIPDERFKRLPLVMLFRDVEERVGQQIGISYEVRMTLAIVTGTRTDAKAEARLNETFKPILYPIYNELIYQIANSGYFLIQGDQIKHTRVDRLYWGSKYVARNGDANQYNDILDGIEITDLELKIYEKNC